MEDNTIKALFAMGCITAIELVLILSGMNGAMATIMVGALAGLGGFAIGTERERRVS